ncbi:hypothetical protein MVEN_01788400 [Mycena venus]|uniref:HIT-type domain-containing protein n=1 Tax=Mycena venus TaxID=2733690 RepID=A0A8H7CN32_9AGAR|nr:hypothetical protein MVEN_01788400 [Mycena venus]
MDSSLPDTTTCRLCRRQFSKYTCPTCNVPYCSLTCFRSEAHSQCSETFYKKEVESDIRAEPSKSAHERQQMLELLKRFEEESAAVEDELEHEDENDLARRLENVDLESTSPDHLWNLLTPSEREKFLKVMEDPSSEVALQLLASEELEVEKQEPWWTAEDLSEPPTKHYGAPPDPIEVPPSLTTPNRTAPSLIYNICAVFITYAYATRHLSASPLSTAPEPDAEAARALFAELTPFLTSRTSKTLHPTLDSALTDLQSRLSPDSATPQLFALLLRDAAALLRHSLVVDAGASPHETYTCCSARARHVAHKLTFYAAFVVGGNGTKGAVLELEREATIREVDVKAEKVEWERVPEADKARKVEIVEL